MNKTTILTSAAAIIFALYWMSKNTNTGQEEDIVDATQTAIDEAVGIISTSPVEGMNTSDAMLTMLKRTEDLRLNKYRLNDGGNGWSIGYGHKFQLGETVLDSITPEQADAMFADDVAQRAEKWVKLYVTVELTQYQFDALVSIAYNMSPQSFKKFAKEVNAGNGIEAIANQSVAWVAPEYQRGINNRRHTEITLFNDGLYA